MKARETGFPHGRADGVAALLGRVRVWWHDQPGGMRASIWAGSAAMLASVGLMLMFLQTLHATVERADLRRAAMLLQGEAAKSCNALRGLSRREACLKQLHAESANAAPGAALDGELVSAVAQTRR